MSTETWVVTGPQAIDADDVRRVVVQLTDGSVDVVADPHRPTGAHVEVGDVSERPLQVSVHDGELRVGYDFAGVEGLVERAKGLRDKDRAVVRLTVPAQVPVKVTTARAAASVVGSRADLSVTTATGASAGSSIPPRCSRSASARATPIPSSGSRRRSSAKRSPSISRSSESRTAWTDAERGSPVSTASSPRAALGPSVVSARSSPSRSETTRRRPETTRYSVSPGSPS